MRRVTIASVAVAVSLAVPAAATAAGGWSKPSKLVPFGKLVYQPAAATARDGTTVVVWTQYDATKNTHALEAAIRTPRGKVSMHKLGPAANDFAKPALAVGGDGTFAVAWEYPGKSVSKSTLAVRIMSRGKTAFGSTMKVSPANMSTDYGAGDAPSVAVDDAGTVYVAWEGVYSGRYAVVETQRTRSARVWSSPVRLSAGGVDSHGARIAADGRGFAAVSWAGSDSSVWASLKQSAQKSFGAAERLAGATYESSPPSIGESDGGKAAMLWEQQTGSRHRIASKVTASGAASFPGRTQYLSGKALAKYQTLAIASSGGGVAAWEAEVAGGWEVDAAALGARSSSWSGGALRLTATGYEATVGMAPVAAANNQRAVVAWSERDLHHASFVGVSVRTARGWQTAKNFPGLNAPVVAVPNDPVRRCPVAGVLIWQSTTAALQISILKP